MMAAALPALAAAGAGAGAGAAGLGLGSSLLLAGTAFSTISGVQSNLYQAKVAENNQKIAGWNAANARRTAAMESQDADFAFAQEYGAEIANESASGLGLQSSSFALRRKAFVQNAALDRARIRQEGEGRAINYENEAAAYGDQAAASRGEAFSTLVGGALQAGGQYANAQAKINQRTARRVQAGYKPLADSGFGYGLY